MSGTLHVELTPESSELCKAKYKLLEIINDTNWDIFKSKSTLIPTLEVQALLSNALKKLNKVNVEFITNEKEEETE